MNRRARYSSRAMYERELRLQRDRHLKIINEVKPTSQTKANGGCDTSAPRFYPHLYDKPKHRHNLWERHKKIYKENQHLLKRIKEIWATPPDDVRDPVRFMPSMNIKARLKRADEINAENQWLVHRIQNSQSKEYRRDVLAKERRTVKRRQRNLMYAPVTIGSKMPRKTSGMAQTLMYDRLDREAREAAEAGKHLLAVEGGLGGSLAEAPETMTPRTGRGFSQSAPQAPMHFPAPPTASRAPRQTIRRSHMMKTFAGRRAQATGPLQGVALRHAAMQQQRRAMQRARAYYELRAALNIQMAARDFLERKAEKEEKEKAALTVQKHLRGHQARKGLGDMDKRRADAAARREEAKRAKAAAAAAAEAEAAGAEAAEAEAGGTGEGAGTAGRRPARPSGRGGRPAPPGRRRVTQAEAEARRLELAAMKAQQQQLAATQLQSIVRGRSARQLRATKAAHRDAALAVQKVVRGHTGRQEAEAHAEELGRRPVLCVGQQTPVEGGGKEFVITRVMWRKDKRRRVVVNSMKPLEPQEDHTCAFSDAELVRMLHMTPDMLRYDARKDLARVVVAALGWDRKGQLGLRGAQNRRPSGAAVVSSGAGRTSGQKGGGETRVAARTS